MCDKCPFVFYTRAVVSHLSVNCWVLPEILLKWNCWFFFYMFRHFDREKEVFTCMHFKCFLRFSMHFHRPRHVVPKPIRSMSYSVARFELARLFKIGKYVGLPESKERLWKLNLMCFAAASVSVFIPQWLHDAFGLSFCPGHWRIRCDCKHIVGTHSEITAFCRNAPILMMRRQKQL